MDHVEAARRRREMAALVAGGCPVETAAALFGVTRALAYRAVAEARWPGALLEMRCAKWRSEIGKLLGDGLTVAEVGRRLGVAERVVRYRMRRAGVPAPRKAGGGA